MKYQWGVWITVILVVLLTLLFLYRRKTENMENNTNLYIEFEEYTYNKEFKLFNPGVFVLKDEIYLVFRYSNFTKYNIPETIKSKLLLYKYNTKEYIWLNFINYESENCNMQGMEDPKVILDIDNNILYIYCSTFDDKCNTVLCRLEYSIDSIENCFTNNKKELNSKSQKILKYEKSKNIEKNWMPFKNLEDNKIYMIYSVYPLIILEEESVSNNDIVYKEILNVKHEELKNARGTSNGILLNNKFIFIIHEKNQNVNDYFNGFMILENKYPFNLQNHTKFTKFTNKNIEFANGLSMYNDKLLISMGIDDCNAGIILTDIEYITTLKNDFKNETIQLKNMEI